MFTQACESSRRPEYGTVIFLAATTGMRRAEICALRRFMETYAQGLGFAPVQVALRAGHDPSVAAKHYTGNVRDADRALASAVAGPLGGWRRQRRSPSVLMLPPQIVRADPLPDDATVVFDPAVPNPAYQR